MMLLLEVEKGYREAVGIVCEVVICYLLAKKATIMYYYFSEARMCVEEVLDVKCGKMGEYLEDNLCG